MTHFETMKSGLLMPYDPKDREIEALRKHITQLRDNLKREGEQHERHLTNYRKEIAKYRTAGKYWIDLEKAIHGNEFLQDAWKSFISTLVMYHQEVIPGVTGPDNKEKDTGYIEEW